MLDIIRKVALQEISRNRGCMLGVVTAVYAHESADDSNNYDVDIKLKHDGLELNKVPVSTAYCGFAAPLRVNDLVIIQFLYGDINQPLITGRFYHDADRPPIHKTDEVIFEHRVTDGTINQIRFAQDGAIYLQRDVTAPEDNSQATGSIIIKPDGSIEIKCEGKPVHVTCKDMTIDGTLTVNGKTTINDDCEISNGAMKTTISGNEITGG